MTPGEKQCQLRRGRTRTSLGCAEKHLPERNTLEGVSAREQSERGGKAAPAAPHVEHRAPGGGRWGGPRPTTALSLDPKDNGKP